MATAWCDLTYEVLVDIFQRLDFEDRYAVVSLVCKPWCRASRDAGCWLSADMERCFATRLDSMPQWWTREFEQKMDKMVRNVVDWSKGTLLELHTRHCSDQAMVHVAARCPELRSLSIKESPNFTDSSATEIAASCSKLRHVDISECQNVSGDFLRELDPGLVSLKRNMITVDWHRRQYIPSEYLQARPKTSADDEAKIIVSRMGNLKYLEFKYSQLSDEGLDELVKNCPVLEYLNLDGCKRLSVLHIHFASLRLKHFIRPSNVPLNYISSLRYGHWQLYNDRFQSFEL